MIPARLTLLALTLTLASTQSSASRAPLSFGDERIFV